MPKGYPNPKSVNLKIVANPVTMPLAMRKAHDALRSEYLAMLEKLQGLRERHNVRGAICGIKSMTQAARLIKGKIEGFELASKLAGYA